MRLFGKGNELNDKRLEESVVRIISATEAEVVLFEARTNRRFESVLSSETIRAKRTLATFLLFKMCEVRLETQRASSCILLYFIRKHDINARLSYVSV